MNKITLKFVFVSIVFSILCLNCGVYTFNGSTLPAHIKTVDIPLFKNSSLEPAIADEITADLSKKIVSENQLRVINERGDASIRGEVTQYENVPYSFGASEVRKVDVDQYIVRITVSVDFVDNQKDKSLFNGSVIGEGIYDYKKETEANGRDRAKQELTKKILEKSIQSW